MRKKLPLACSLSTARDGCGVGMKSNCSRIMGEDFSLDLNTEKRNRGKKRERKKNKRKRFNKKG